MVLWPRKRLGDRCSQRWELPIWTKCKCSKYRGTLEKGGGQVCWKLILEGHRSNETKSYWLALTCSWPQREWLLINLSSSCLTTLSTYLSQHQRNSDSLSFSSGHPSSLSLDAHFSLSDLCPWLLPNTFSLHISQTPASSDMPDTPSSFKAVGVYLSIPADASASDLGQWGGGKFKRQPKNKYHM